MFIKLFSYFFGNNSKKKIIELKNIILKINDLESIFNNYSDIELKENTYKFRDKLLSGFNIKFILHEIFANIREAIKRIFNIRLFDVQLLGALIMYNGCIAEMKTGEGKTITSTLPAYFYSLFGKGVHILTINDYLAKRDFINNRKLFNFLGLDVGLNLPGMSLLEKKKSYLCDITYGTSSEFGFDYLKDNMVFSLKDKVQRKYNFYAILDEIDSILIDESRTPLIISGSDEYYFDIYNKINNIVLNLLPQYEEDSDCFKGFGDFVIDKENRNIFLTERGIIKIEKLLVSNFIIKNCNLLYNINNIKIMHYVVTSLKAIYLYKKNIDYLIKDKSIIIIDEHSGRMVPDRRWSDGLHQAIEAKENLNIKKENKTLAIITFQNYFKLYNILSGMTGTAVTEASEFSSIYNIETIIVPTNKPMIRIDYPDIVFLSEEEKFNFIIKDIINKFNKKQPVLVGTRSIEKSEYISFLLKKKNIPHKILNAKYHMLEAKIISQAGRAGSVTIATNMAGRGTDIILGGSLNDIFSNKDYNKNLKNNWKKNHDFVVSLGGLYVIGTERHESRRLDNQLRGRSGRQGDPGSSRFYVSMDDSLMSNFSSKNIVFFMKKLGMKYGENIEHYWVSKSIEKAQKKIENMNFDIRRQLLEYDDIYNDQRKIIYSKRDSFLYYFNIKKKVFGFIKNVSIDLYNLYKNNILSFRKRILYLNIKKKKCFSKFNIFLFKIFICRNIFLNFKTKESFLGKKVFLKFIRNILLKTLDFFWKEYLYVIDNLKESLYLYSYAQKNPKHEYRIKSFEMFDNMLINFNYKIIKLFFNIPNNLNEFKKMIILYDS